MLMWLYTSRVILQALGVEDYGVSNVVGGVVGLFAFLRTSMTKSTQRFLNVEMTKTDGKLNETFCTSLNIHLFIGLIALIITETIGLWFLNTYIQIPEGREFAANIIYQSTILSLIVTIVSVPYSADIIAHEEMGYFAVVSIVDAILRLAIALLIAHSNGDRLIFYGVLMAVISIVNLLMYIVYCRVKYEESKYHMMLDKQLTKDLFGYTTWTVVGQAAVLGTNQGNNILLNMFHGVVSNAAMGVAQQVNGAVSTLTSNFQTAFNPQITKSYASKDYDYLKKLVYATSKISFFLLVVVSLPIMFNISFLLNLWLDEVPPYAEVFCILILCNSILNALSAPLNYTVLSSGKIKWFQIFSSFAFLSDLIILYPLFLLGFPPATALCVKVVSMILVVFVRLYFAQREVECINIYSYTRQVLMPLALSTGLSIIAGCVLFNLSTNLCQTVLATLGLIVTIILNIMLFGLSKSERGLIIKVMRRIIK